MSRSMPCRGDLVEQTLFLSRFVMTQALSALIEQALHALLTTLGLAPGLFVALDLGGETLEAVMLLTNGDIELLYETAMAVESTDRDPLPGRRVGITPVLLTVALQRVETLSLFVVVSPESAQAFDGLLFAPVLQSGQHAQTLAALAFIVAHRSSLSSASRLSANPTASLTSWRRKASSRGCISIARSMTGSLPAV